MKKRVKTGTIMHSVYASIADGGSTSREIARMVRQDGHYYGRKEKTVRTLVIKHLFRLMSQGYAKKDKETNRYFRMYPREEYKNFIANTERDIVNRSAKRNTKDKVRGTCMAGHIDISIAERVKNALFRTPGRTISQFVAAAVKAEIERLEEQNGGPFESRHDITRAQETAEKRQTQMDIEELTSRPDVVQMLIREALAARGIEVKNEHKPDCTETP